MVQAATPEGYRFQAWVTSVVFSCVCLAAHASTTNDGKRDGAEKWVLAQLSIEFIFSFAAVVAYFFAQDKFVGQKAEGGLAFLLVTFWCAGLPTIMNPSRRIAVSEAGAPVVSNANLYFFSWAAFVCILFVLGDYLQEFTGRDVASEISPKQSKWMGLLAASIVVMASSSEIHRTTSCTTFLQIDFCSRNAYAISLGVIGTLASLIVIYMTQMGKLTAIIESITSALMLIMYTFGVAFVTFGSGSGTTIGNLYFSLWIGFCIATFLGFQCFREFMETRTSGGAPASATVTKVGNKGETKAAAAPSLEEVEQANVPTEAVAVDVNVDEEAP